jgi:hypothetical protein
MVGPPLAEGQKAKPDALPTFLGYPRNLTSMSLHLSFSNH